MVIILTLAVIIGSAFVLKHAKIHKKFSTYSFVLISGIITLLFTPTLNTLLSLDPNGAIDVAVQLFSTIFGIYLIVWSIRKMVESQKNMK